MWKSKNRDKVVCYSTVYSSRLLHRLKKYFWPPYLRFIFFAFSHFTHFFLSLCYFPSLLCSKPISLKPRREVENLVMGAWLLQWWWLGGVLAVVRLVFLRWWWLGDVPAMMVFGWGYFTSFFKFYCKYIIEVWGNFWDNKKVKPKE